MIIYDFEVFKLDWLAVFLDCRSRKFIKIANDPKQLKELYELHKNDIWVGYNNLHYDQYIFKSIMLGMNPKTINDMIIRDGKDGWQISNRFRDIPMYNYDVFNRADGGLKSLEGFMGHDIQESSVPFDIDRKLTEKELEEVFSYCTHDVAETFEVFLNRIDDFNATMRIILIFKLHTSNISLTHAQLAAKVVGCVKQKHDDEYEFMDVVPKSVDVGRYKDVLDFYQNVFTDVQNELKDYDGHDYDDVFRKKFYSKSYKTDVAGIPHVFGWGGVHGASDKPVHKKGRIIHVDVTSYYPSLMIQHNLITRNATNPKKFEEVYNIRVELKKAGKDKEQAPYKIILNSMYGISGDKFSPAYDPRNRNAVCVVGQLMLVDLIDKLEDYCELIQSNTDGLIIRIKDTPRAYRQIKKICTEWEERNRISLGFDDITEIWQGDVNNYVFKFSNGKLERKGAYVKKLDDLCFDLPIVNKAILDRLTKGTPVETTIKSCTDLRMFQKIFKVSGKYASAWHNNKYLPEKCHRVFASKNESDTHIGKIKNLTHGKVEKFANSPEHCFIDNGDVTNKVIPERLDREWYINLAKKRLWEKFHIR